jgi:hypothetical protein
MSVTHVAGNMIKIAPNRAIQRCMICGDKMRDTQGEMGCDGPNGEPYVPSFWTVGHLISFSDGNPCQQTDIGSYDDDSVDIPEDSCIALVE